MDFKEYQKLAHRTSTMPIVGEKYVYPVLGLSGEAGEVANKVQKIFRDDKGVLTEARLKDVKHELGDVLWYLAEICTCMDIDFEEIAKANIEMLASRLERNKISGDGDNR